MTRETSPAFATVSGGGPSPLRHHLAHLQIVDPDDVRRFAELGVAANMQALWACYDEQMVGLTLPYLDAEAATPMFWRYCRWIGETLRKWQSLMSSGSAGRWSSSHSSGAGT